MSNVIDARGLSCPEPVLLTLRKLGELTHGELKVLVDTDTAKENVRRAAQSKGWTVSAALPADLGYEISLSKLA